MEYRFEFAREMLDQVAEILDWFTRNAPERSEAWEQGLFDRIDTLRVKPTRCPIAEGPNKFGEAIRFLTYGKKTRIDRIFFTIEENLIRIVSILHASQSSMGSLIDTSPSNHDCKEYPKREVGARAAKCRDRVDLCYPGVTRSADSRTPKEIPCRWPRSAIIMRSWA